ncbi:MAG: hypothetical protein AAF480_11100 [Actinomycetota bacterium]
MSPGGWQWEPLGRLAVADGRHRWCHSHLGAATTLPPAGDRVTVLVTGRDADNRSMIGRGELDLSTDTPTLDLAPEPLLEPGSLGTFDENGVSYPCAVAHGSEVWCYYTGWMPTVLTPFQNHIGLARLGDGRLERISRAPVLPRTDDDHLSMGSCFVLREQPDRWRMWYTSFTSWGTGPSHRYLIKYAESADGLDWRRDGHVAIGPADADEHSISRPTVVRDEAGHHMWFCVRGDDYRIGYAWSADGIDWERDDGAAGIGPGTGDWDDRAQAYPHVFRAAGSLWMLYAGNDYGADGIGIARGRSA